MGLISKSTATKKRRRSSKYPKWVNNLIANGVDTDSMRQLLDFITGSIVPEDFSPLEPLAVYLLPSVSREEKEWIEGVGLRVIEEKFPAYGPPMFCGYEWISFKVPGGTYTPDYSYRFRNGKWIHFEIKGSPFQPNLRDARSKIRIAATVNPWDTFAWAMRKGAVPWEVQIVKPDPDWLQTFYYEPK